MKLIIDGEGVLMCCSQLEKNNQFNFTNLFLYLKEQGVSEFDMISFQDKLKEKMILGVMFLVGCTKYISILSVPIGNDFFELTLTLIDR